MINGIKAFGYIKKTHAGYLVFVNINKPIIDDAMQTWNGLLGMQTGRVW